MPEVLINPVARRVWLTIHILKDIHRAYNLSLSEDEDYLYLHQNDKQAYVFTRYAETTEVLKCADQLVGWAISGIEFNGICNGVYFKRVDG